MKFAEPKDVNMTIQVLKQLKDKLKMQQSYSIKIMEPSINRMLLELEDMLKVKEYDV